MRSTLLQFSIPCTLSLLVSSLYNIVDQIFIGHGVGYLGNGATNVVFPLTIITLAFSLMLGDGTAAFLSICSGKNDSESSHKSVGNTVVLGIIIGLVLTTLFAFGKDGLLATFGATEANMPYAEEYFQHLLIGIPFFMVSIQVFWLLPMLPLS